MFGQAVRASGISSDSWAALRWGEMFNQRNLCPTKENMEVWSQPPPEADLGSLC